MKTNRMKTAVLALLALTVLSACGKSEKMKNEPSAVPPPETAVLTAAEEADVKARVEKYKEENPNISVTWFKIRCGDEETVYCTTINLAMNHWAQSSYSDGWELHDDEEEVVSTDGCWRLLPGEDRDIYSPIVSHRVYEAEYIGDRAVTDR